MTSTSESENSEDIGRTAVVLSSPKNAHKFVDDWLMFNTVLGEGAYGEVRLVLNKKTNEKVACKIINMSKIKGNERIVSKEIRLHTLTTHHNIIRCFGLRKDVDRVYLFLEYASGGELFQQIEPGVGMPVRKVQNYMKQLVDAVMYLHQKGIAHRDIKPENILLGENGVLKLSDFGLATIFRYKGKERMLDAKCGTKPYLAHEVLLGPYHAVPADIWSCGCVLVAMLVGELLWDCPTESSREFRVYKEGNFLSTSPWNRLANLPLNLVTKLLHINPNKRISLENVLKHPWMTYEFSNDYKSNSVDNPDGLVRGASLMEAVNVVRETNVTLSQPNLPSKPICLNKIINDQPKISNKNGNLWFSQPVSNEDLIITPSWKFREAPITKDNFDDFVKRLTRFFVTTSTVEQGIEVLCATLDKLRYTWTVDCTGTVTISTVDNIKNQLIFKVMPIKMETKILFDFRLTKGCGLEFKRKFMKIKECVSHIVDKENS